MRTDVISVGVADKDAFIAPDALVRIKPQAQLRQMNPGTGELNVQRHTGSLGACYRESNPGAQPSFSSLSLRRLV
jgi:hypothetical protein